MTEDRPTLMVIAGPNGSGKSSLTRAGLPGDKPVIDPDALARQIDPTDVRGAGVAAGREALRQQQDFLNRGESFAVETTLSGNRSLKLMDDAKDRGYEVQLHFVRLDTPEANVERVATRVEQGGHGIPTEDIYRRFDRSMSNLPNAIAKADSAVLYDNSGVGVRRVAQLSSTTFSFRDEPPVWATDGAMDAARKLERESTSETEGDQWALRYAEAAVASGAMSDTELEDLKERIENPGDSETDSGTTH